MTLVNCALRLGQSASTEVATALPVKCACRAITSRSQARSSGSSRCSSTISVLTVAGSRPSTNAMPPDMPAAMLRPVLPSTTTRPPVMYSQAWSPTPSTTVSAPELRAAEPLAHPAAQVHLAGRGAEQQRVACDHVVLGQEQDVVGRPDDDAATRKPLADIVVGVADQLEGDTGRQERADRLARRAGQRDVDGVVGQTLRAVAAGDLGAEQGADGAVDVAHRQFQPHRMRVLECPLGELDQRLVQGVIEAVVLVAHAPCAG